MERSFRRAEPAPGIFASRDLTAPDFGFLQRRREIHGGGGAPAARRLVDPVAPWRIWRGKITALRAVSANGHHHPIPAEVLLRRLTEWSERLVVCRRPGEISALLWQMETLSSRFFELGGEGFRLDERLPLAARPIAHSGLGMAAAVRAGFDPHRLERYLEEHGAAEYLFFAYEGAGAMLAAFRADAFGRFFHLMGRLKWTQKLPGHRYRRDVFEQLRDNRAGLMGHGYGRLLYLKTHSLAAAVRAARRTPYLPFDALVRGIAAAYAMVNSTVLPKALGLADAAARLPEVSEPIRDGLINVMAFFEWMAPGCLGDVEAPGESAAALVRVAEEEARAARREGLPPPFALGLSGGGR